MPLGEDLFVTRDGDKPHTGDQSPLVKLDKSEPHGFAQSGLVVRNVRAYTGRIVFTGSSTAAIEEALV